jgi:hypothetical protein
LLGAAAARTPTAHTSVQWATLAWIAGAAVAATLIIAVIVLLSRRPKSMEDGIAEFSRSLQAVAPVHRLGQRPSGDHVQLGPTAKYDESPLRARRGETEAV